MSYAPRHARPVSRRRRAVGSVAAVSMLAGGAALSPGSTASAADVCLTPVVQDIMISQGLPSYGSLVRGKTTLVKFFMQKNSCAPAGAAIRITGATLNTTINGATIGVPPLGVLPLPAIAPSTTAPVPAAEGDPVFKIAGSDLNPAGDTTTVTFTATIDFTTTKADGTKVSDRLVVTKRKDGVSPITAKLDRASNPLRVLTVPMGNAGTVLAPNTAASQFPASAQAALTKGLTAVGRVLPVADGVSELNGTSGGLRSTLATGLVDLSKYMASGRFCGDETSFTDIDRQLNLARINWNSVNPSAPADRVYGVVSSTISDGGVTGNRACVDGFAAINGTSAWGRVADVVTDSSTSPPATRSFTGAIATMELLHTTGAVDSDDPRYTGGFHSKNQQADLTAPDRAWNVNDQKWIQNDASGMLYRTDGIWNDATSVLEQPDFDRLHCQLTPLLPGETSACPNSSAVGRAAAAVTGTTDGSFFLSGSTDGTPAGTDAHTYIDDDVNYEKPDPTSDYRFAQVDAAGNIIDEQGFRVTTGHSHNGSDADEGDEGDAGVFGTEFEAFAETTEIRLYKGDPDLPGAVLLYKRVRDEAPVFLSATLQGRAVAVQATDRTPENLRLDVFHVCGSVVSPVVNAAKPLLTGNAPNGLPVAAFGVPADTSLGCANGTLRYRMSDGFLVATRDDAMQQAGQRTANAAIYAPVKDVSLTRQPLGLSGDARDALDRPLANLTWTLSGPGLSPTVIATGRNATYKPPALGLAAGLYTLRLDASSTPGGTPVATTSKVIRIKQDTDFDGLEDVVEQQSCFPLAAYLDDTTATADYDFDGYPNVNDPQPCVTANNAKAVFTSTSLNTGSNGNNVTMRLDSTQVDLTKLTAADLSIIQIGGFVLASPMPANGYTVTSPTTAKVTFDRTPLSAFLTRERLSGPIPVFVGSAANGGLRAGDADAPNTF